jgi:hypothetical protein
VSHRLKRPIAGSDRSRPEAPIYPDGANGGEPINHAVPDETARKRARLNCISHILGAIPFKKAPREKVKLPKRSMRGRYDDQATLRGMSFVKERY